MTHTRTETLARARKLHERTASSNKHEADSARVILDALMEKHGLTAEDVARVTVFVGPVDVRPWWRELASALARKYGLRAGWIGKALVFKGYKADAEVARDAFLRVSANLLLRGAKAWTEWRAQAEETTSSFDSLLGELIANPYENVLDEITGTTSRRQTRQTRSKRDTAHAAYLFHFLIAATTSIVAKLAPPPTVAQVMAGVGIKPTVLEARKLREEAGPSGAQAVAHAVEAGNKAGMIVTIEPALKALPSPSNLTMVGILARKNLADLRLATKALAEAQTEISCLKTQLADAQDSADFLREELAAARAALELARRGPHIPAAPPKPDKPDMPSATQARNGFSLLEVD